MIHLEVVSETLKIISLTVKKYYRTLIAGDRASFHFLFSNLHNVMRSSVLT